MRCTADDGITRSIRNHEAFRRRGKGGERRGVIGKIDGREDGKEERQGRE